MTNFRHLVMCSDQLLASKFHNNFNARNKSTKENCSPPYFYFLTWDKFAWPYASPCLAHNFSSDWLWAPLPYILYLLTKTLFNHVGQFH